MTTKTQNELITIRGTTSYAKVLPHQLAPNFAKDGKEWSVDIKLNDPAGDEKRFKKIGIADRIRQKETYLDGAEFMTFRQPELKADGTPNKPIKIVDAKGRDWDNETEIGNGSVVDVRFAVKDYGPGKKKGVYIRGIRVLEHVPYEKADLFEPLDENDEFYVEGDADGDDLDDNLPF